LLALAATCVAGGVAVAGLWPLAGQRAAALAELDDARALKLWVEARAEEARQLRSLAGPAKPDPVGLAALQDSLARARLADKVATLSAREGGGIDLRFQAVAFDPLMDWISQIAPVWGYRIDGFRVERGSEEGLVTASFRLLPDV
jgi:type II secretory pathway component PulM